ncbi:MAG: hypothetical protein JXQ87_04675 [Bacteroidia bacterium]
MRSILLVLAIAFTLNLKAQIPEIKPSAVYALNFSKEGEEQFNRDSDTMKAIFKKLSEGASEDDLTKSQIEVWQNFDETMESYYQTEGGGCSWYCGGGPYEVTGSSFLNSSGSIDYKPENAHDFSFKSAWVEGDEGYGVGEYLLYHFSPESPRITSISVANGYVKSETAWNSNSRVKKLKVYFNEYPVAILNLEDSRSQQVFRVDTLGHGNRRNMDDLKALGEWKLKFEILEVYKGDLYKDVVISEISFDGVDVHCFAKGTKVLLADSSELIIEDLRLGDTILSYDLNTNRLKQSIVEKTEKVVHTNLVRYDFESGNSIITTRDHPFLVNVKGWASLLPKKSSIYEGFDGISNVEVGDVFIQANSTDTLVAISPIKNPMETFTISRLSLGNTFIANGFIVGVETVAIKP